MPRNKSIAPKEPESLIKRASKAAIDFAGSIPRGLLGIGDEPNIESPLSEKLGYTLGELAPDILGAGIPFPAGKYVFHGTRGKPFTRFDPLRVNRADLMSTPAAMHFAQKPHYTLGFTPSAESGGNVRISQLDVSDKLDLMGGLDPEDLYRLKQAGLEKSLLSQNPPWYASNPQSILADIASNPSSEATSESLSNIFRRDPELLNKAGFEGVRYSDYGQPAWAIQDPSREKLKAIIDPNEIRSIPKKWIIQEPEAIVGEKNIRDVIAGIFPDTSKIGDLDTTYNILQDQLKNSVISRAEYTHLMSELATKSGI